MKATEKAVVAVVGDLHCNSMLGLCPDEDIRLDDGGSYSPSVVQKWMWQKWLDYFSAVKSTAKKHKAPLYLILNGDLVDGDHHNTVQIISRNMEIQHRIVMDALAPALKLKPEAVFVVRGTEAHVGRGAIYEEAVGRTIDAEIEPKTGASSWYQLRAELGGVLFDVTHHGPIGRLPWTIGNILNRVAAEEVFAAASRGCRPADVMVQNHNHVFGTSSDDYKTKVFANGAWQFATSYVSRVAPRAVPSVGGLVFTCESGSYTWDQHIYRPERTEPWRPGRKK